MSDSSLGPADYSYKRIKTAFLPQSSLNSLNSSNKLLALSCKDEATPSTDTDLRRFCTDNYAFKMLLDASRPEKFP